MHIVDIWGSGILLFALVCFIFVCSKEVIEHFKPEHTLFGFYVDDFSPFWAFVCGIACVWTLACFVTYLIAKSWWITAEPSVNLLYYFYYLG